MVLKTSFILSNGINYAPAGKSVSGRQALDAENKF